MKYNEDYEVAIVGGSFAGLSAAMALGRSLRKTLIIDGGQPCNQQTPQSHNFITHDGEAPLAILTKARQQVLSYSTVTFKSGLVTQVLKHTEGFEVTTDDGLVVVVKKILFATGVRDIMPSLKGFASCWGISVLHCPYCHGYEVRSKATGIFAKGEVAIDFAKIIKHWTKNLTVFTNGDGELTDEQKELLDKWGVGLNEKPIVELTHQAGYVQHLVFSDGTTTSVEAIYARPPYEQYCPIPLLLGCEVSETGHLVVDQLQKTSVTGVYAAGDNTTPFRAVSIAVAAGTKAGAMINMELIEESS
ncbi:MAG: NAD(P)/FAD-dependent oxidoreductase [Bacteroidota bacterium]